MRYLITGATGFVGPYLVRKLVSLEHECRCLVRSAVKAKTILQPGVDLVEGDVTEMDSLKGIASGMDGIFHLATLGHMHNFEAPPSMFENVNVRGTINMMNEALLSGVKKVVHCSSVAAMGICREIPANEESECVPHHPYGKSKLQAEKEVRKLMTENNLPAVIVRFSMVYGPGDPRDILRLARLAKKRMLPKIGNAPKLTPLVHVDDAVQGLLLAMEKGRMGEAYLITNAQSEPFDDLIRIIRETLGAGGIAIPLPAGPALVAAGAMEFVWRLLGKVPPVTRKNIESTLADRVFSIEKARRELGFEPQVDPVKGLTETIRWYMENGWI